MKITPYKTKKVVVGDDLYKILDKYLPRLHEKDLVVITSKVIAICQGRVVKNDGKVKKDDLVKKEAEFYLPEKYTNYGVFLTIKNKIIIASAGVDESNANGYFILWPQDLQQTTNEIWRYLRKKHKVKSLGVVVTDSKLTPLRRGVTGYGLSWCGFEPLRNYIGTPDIFGHKLKVTKTNIVDGLAASAVLEMGEGKEQTPLSVISGISNIEFVQRIPSKKELSEMTIEMKNDIFASLLKSAKWIKGGAK
jgi:putative folate metabolism gamma-glutamate ligase